MKSAIVIGSGIGGLATACLLGKRGYSVRVFEKNEQLGGRASVFGAEGFRFDMGPSWYLMPDIFEHFFALMGERVEDHLSLIRLAPSYRIFFKDEGKQVDLYSDIERDRATLEALEPGSSQALIDYLHRAEEAYEISKRSFMYKNYDSLRDLFTWEAIKNGRRLSVFSNMHDYICRFFKTNALQKILEYQLVFLGSSPYDTPALYSIMNHIDFKMGVYYPQGGIYEIVKALVRLAEKHGATFQVNAAVERILVEDGHAVGIRLADGKEVRADLVVSNADIHHTDTKLLPRHARQYNDKYWNSRVLAPSALILYLGVRGRIPSLTHHNLLFSKDWKQNFTEIFDKPQWPTDPSIYVCAPSVTDPTVAPTDMENLFVLVPIASGLKYAPEDLERETQRIIKTLETSMHIPDLSSRIVYQKTFCVKDFAERYNSFQGTALGLAHTLKQTATFRPNNINPKVENLYYVGGNTNPGIGMPICLISAELVLKRLMGDKSGAPLSSI